MIERLARDGATIRIDLGGDGIIRQIDNRFVVLTGWSMADTLGQPIGLLFGPRTSRELVDRLLKAIERGEAVAPVGTQLYRMNGESFAATVELIIDRGTGLVRIRTDSSGAAAAAADGAEDLWDIGAERVLEAVLEAVPDGILMVDGRELVRVASPALLELWRGSHEDLAGRSLEQVLEWPGSDLEEVPDGISAAQLIMADGRRRPVTVVVSRGADASGHRFQVMVVRSAGTVRGAGPRLGMSVDAVVAAAAHALQAEKRAAGFGLLEFELSFGLEEAMGSQADAVLERAVKLALGVVATLLEPLEFVCAPATDRLLLLFEAGDWGQATERVQRLAQEVRDRLIVAGEPLSDIDVYAAVEWVEPGSELATGLVAGAGDAGIAGVVERLTEQSRTGRGATVLADLLDQAEIEVLPVRTAAGMASRYGLVRLDRHSRQRFDWLKAQGSSWTEATAVEFDLLVFSRAAERMQRRGIDGRSLDPPILLVPMPYGTVIEAEAGERLNSLSRGLGAVGRNRLALLVHDLPDAVAGRGLVELIRRGFGLARFLVLEPGTLGDAGAVGADEGLLALSVDFSRLGARIKQDPVPFRHLSDRLQKRGVATILRNIETPEVAALLSGLFPHVLLSGDGVEQWASQVG